MFRIREQLATALAADYERRLEQRLMALLRSYFANAASAPDADLQTAVREAVAKARGYGLDTEQAIAVYSVVSWTVGRDFDRTYPAAQRTLLARESATAKADWLERWCERVVAQRESGK